ncbi:MAG: ATP-binding protein, partial [Daejeonella sp.]
DALEWQAKDFEKRTKIKCYFTSTIDESLLDKSINTTLFRIFQESLTNITRHANATNVWAQLKKENNSIKFSIADDGKGMDLSEIKTKHTLGLIGMEERINSVNGGFSIDSSIGKGTVITVSVPIKADSLNIEPNDTYSHS